MKPWIAALSMGVLILAAQASSPVNNLHTSPIAAMLRAAPEDVKLELKGDTKVVQVDKVVIVKEDLLTVNSFPFTVTAPAGGFIYSWQYPASVEAVKKGNRLDVTKAPNGMLTISVEYGVVDFKAQTTDIKFGSVSFSVGAPAPPKPPDPPKPPEPPTPIPLAGFRVVVMYDKAVLTADQEAVVYGREVRDYLEAKCWSDPETSSKAYWIIPAGSDVGGTPGWVRDTVQRHPGLRAWFVVSDGKTGFDGPIPANKIDALAVLRKVGG